MCKGPLNWSAVIAEAPVEGDIRERIVLSRGGIKETVYESTNGLPNRAFGFSDFGKSFVWARSSDLHIYNLDYGYKYEDIQLITSSPREAMRIWTSSFDAIYQDQDEDLLFYNHQCIIALIDLCNDVNNVRRIDTINR